MNNFPDGFDGNLPGESKEAQLRQQFQDLSDLDKLDEIWQCDVYIDIQNSTGKEILNDVDLLNKVESWFVRNKMQKPE